MAGFRHSRRLTLITLAALIAFSTLCYRTMYEDSPGNRWSALIAQHEETSEQVPIDFAGFDNETGRTFGERLIVPNVIHYIRFNKTLFSFVDYVCLRSAYLRQRPERIYLHTNMGADSFTGHYWDRIRAEADLYARITIEPIELPGQVFGQQLSEGWRLYHGSDVARIRTMMKHGGIYLDNDVYVVQNLDKYRKFEIAMGWDEGQFLGSQVIVAHKDARFLPLWLDTYRQYHAELW